MVKTPFLYRFRQDASTDEPDDGDVEELYFCLERKLNVTGDGQIAWSARSRRYPTRCYTNAHRLRAGYTSSGKWKPSKVVPGKSDRRAGR